MATTKRSGLVVAVIGAGSTYTPMIVRELADRQSRLPVEELRLYDIDRRRLSIVAGFSRRLAGDEISITTPGRLAKALDGAHFVMSQFRVGQLAARHRDIKLGLKHGLIGQETTGIGGFAKALRTIPVTLALCRAMSKHAARGAWLINFTNPSAIITEAALKHGGVQAIGLCNGPAGMVKQIAQALAVNPGDVDVDYVGTNHCAWIRGVRVAGQDWTARARRAHARFLAKNIPHVKLDPVFERTVGLPYNGYLHYYYYTDAMFEKIASAKRTRAQEALAIERVLLRKYADPKTVDLPEELSRRGGGGYNLVAADILEAIARDLGNVQIVNVQNAGAIEGIEDDSVVEISARVSKKGARPIPFGKLEPPYRGLLQVVKAYEELAVQAGAKGDLEAALHALVIHPLGPTASKATAVLRDLVRVNRDYLPQFSQAKVRRFLGA